MLFRSWVTWGHGLPHVLVEQVAVGVQCADEVGVEVVVPVVVGVRVGVVVEAEDVVVHEAAGDCLEDHAPFFGGAEGRFTKTRGLIEVSKFRSAGPSLGLTAAGKIDLDRNNVNVKGTLVPAYAINSVLGNIPLIGAIIQGGEGEGLFAATYAVTGNLDEPKIDVNEWSALAPGFIRDLFTTDGTENEEDNPDDEEDLNNKTEPQTPGQLHPGD